MKSRPLRTRAIRNGLLRPHPLPCRLVKNENGNWVEAAWIIEEGKR